MKHFSRGSSVLFIVAFSGLLFGLSGCNSDDIAEAIAEEVIGTANISGTVTDSGDSPLLGVNVKGVYPDDTIGDTGTEITGTSGTFTIEVLRQAPVYLNLSKSGHVTLNSEAFSLDADQSGYVIEMPTTTEAQDLIDSAFGAGSGLSLGSYGWLAIDIVDGSDIEVDGVVIAVSPVPDAAVYTDCSGADSGLTVTEVDVSPCDRPGPMYLAYFDADSAEVSVTVSGTGKAAKVIRGQVTYIEFVTP